jgi:hypothetical protein
MGVVFARCLDRNIVGEKHEPLLHRGLVIVRFICSFFRCFVVFLPSFLPLFVCLWGHLPSD